MYHILETGIDTTEYNDLLPHVIFNVEAENVKKNNYTHPWQQIESAIRTWVSRTVFGNKDLFALDDNNRGYIRLSDEHGDAMYFFRFTQDGDVEYVFEVSPDTEEAKNWIKSINKKNSEAAKSTDIVDLDDQKNENDFKDYLISLRKTLDC